jgi:hypothetical protein
VLAVRTLLLHLFFATFALQVMSEPRRAAGVGKNPMTRRERRLMSHVLKVSTLKRSAPVSLVVSFKACDFLFHRHNSMRES